MPAHGQGIVRSKEAEAVAIGQDVADSTAIDFRAFAGGAVFVPDTEGLSQLDIWAQEPDGSDFYPAYDENGDPLSVLVSTMPAWYFLPDRVYPLAIIKLVSLDADVEGATVRKAT